MPIDFVAVDFETANFSRGSACAVGVARVRAGRVVEQAEWFIEPPGGPFFTNTHIHGIDHRHVAGAPSWNESLAMLDRFVAADDLIAYSGFDRGVYNAANTFHAIERPDYRWRNALSLVQRRYPLDAHGLEDHRLPSIVKLFGLGDFEHHRAADDAAMCARIVARIAVDHRIDDLDALWPMPGARNDKSRTYVYKPAAPLPIRNETADPAHPLFGETVCFSGDLEGFGRKDAQQIVADFGATVSGNVTKKTTLVVMGRFDPSTLKVGAALSAKVERAIELRTKGQRVEVIDEPTFIELINLDPAA